jgi:hypothetical protein
MIKKVLRRSAKPDITSDFNTKTPKTPAEFTDSAQTIPLQTGS